MKRTAAVLLVLVFSTLPLFGKDVHGVKFDDRVTVDGKQLALNGAGLRTKLMVKVYVAGLYAEKTSKDAGQIINSDQAKQVRLVVLRDLGKAKIADAIEEGFEKNSKARMPALRQRLNQFKAAIPDLKENEQLVFSYVPGRGTVVNSKSGETVIPGKDFADALFSVWLGNSPVDGALKKGMLGV